MKPEGAEPGRLPHVDAMRGLAVICMLWMHTGDGWLAAPYRSGQPWDLVRALGGLAAPLFLLLSGVSLGIARARRPGSARGETARALQLVLLGYLLRVQMWVVDGAGYASASASLGAVLLAGGYLWAFHTLELWARPRSPRPRWMRGWLGSGLLVVGGLAWVAWQHPARLPGLLRQDVLQAIGASLLITAWLTRRVGPWGAALAALAVALSTQPMRAWVPGPLPHALAAYLAHWSPGPGKTPAGLFPLFPWLSYPLLGYGVGRLWGGRRRGDAEELAIVLAAAGAVLALCTCELFGHVRHAMLQWPWLVQPLRVAYRLGVALMFGALAVALAHPRFPLRRPLLALGQASLCVYWVHLSFAFGALARPVHRALSPSQWALCLALLTAAMVGVAELWRRRRQLLRWARDRGRGQADFA